MRKYSQFRIDAATRNILARVERLKARGYSDRDIANEIEKLVENRVDQVRVELTKEVVRGLEKSPGKLFSQQNIKILAGILTGYGLLRR